MCDTNNVTVGNITGRYHLLCNETWDEHIEMDTYENVFDIVHVRILLMMAYVAVFAGCFIGKYSKIALCCGSN